MAPPQYPPYASPYQQQAVPQPPPPQQQQPVPYPQPHIVPEVPQAPQAAVVPPTDVPSTSANGRRPTNSVQTAAASLESVERAIGDLRATNGPVGRGGRRGHHGHGPTVKGSEFKVPATDFDFASSNARFDKSAIAPKKGKEGKEGKDASEGEGVSSEGGADTPSKEEDDKERAYNPQKSFFDSLSSSTQSVPPPSRGGAGRRGGGGRNRREEEREKNVATFGEAGGIGLMGPGAYVGGWGGYGRRGGGRPRRGVPAGGR